MATMFWYKLPIYFHRRNLEQRFANASYRDKNLLVSSTKPRHRRRPFWEKCPCPRATSCRLRLQPEYLLLSGPSRILQRLPNLLSLNVQIRPANLLDGLTAGEQFKDQLYSILFRTNGRQIEHHLPIKTDALQAGKLHHLRPSISRP
jgi:hypothetical protein